MSQGLRDISLHLIGFAWKEARATVLANGAAVLLGIDHWNSKPQRYEPI